MPLFYSDGQPAADIEALPEIKVTSSFIISRMPHSCCFCTILILKKLNFNQDIDNHPKIEPSIEHDQEQKILLSNALSNFKPFTTTTVIY